MNQGKFFMLLVILCYTLSSCSDSWYDSYVSTGGNWDKNDPLKFEVSVTDTLQSSSIFINIRNRGNYPYSNLYLFVTTTAPTGNFITDTLQVQLAKPSGRWLGKGYGSLFSLQIPYRRNIRFPFTGIYTFTVEQGMRDDVLKGIEDIGLKIQQIR